MMQSSNLIAPQSVGRNYNYLSPRTDAHVHSVHEADAVPFDAPVFALLNGSERSAMIQAVAKTVSIASGQSLVSRSRRSAYLPLVVEGWAYRCSTLSNGARQITDLLIPGDLIDCWRSDDGCAITDVRAAGPARIALLRSDSFVDVEGQPLHDVLKRARQAEALGLRRRLISIGRRDARGRLAHLIAELHGRLSRIGLADDARFHCPLTQEQLADALGLTSVHVNRVLQRLRRDNIVSFIRRDMIIHDVARLHDEADSEQRSTCIAPGRPM